MEYGLAVFRSRRHTLETERAFRGAGIAAQAVTTPRSLSVGCGISVRFDIKKAARALELCRLMRLPSFAGVFSVTQQGARILARRLDG